MGFTAIYHRSPVPLLFLVARLLQRGAGAHCSALALVPLPPISLTPLSPGSLEVGHMGPMLKPSQGLTTPEAQTTNSPAWPPRLCTSGSLLIPSWSQPLAPFGQGQPVFPALCQQPVYLCLKAFALALVLVGACLPSMLQGTQSKSSETSAVILCGKSCVLRRPAML